MPRTRAYRRHKRAVKLARRYRILNAYGRCRPFDPRARHWHINCNCWNEPRKLERRRQERTWRRGEGV